MNDAKETEQHKFNPKSLFLVWNYFCQHKIAKFKIKYELNTKRENWLECIVYSVGSAVPSIGHLQTKSKPKEYL